jgi:hypothetical protein
MPDRIQLSRAAGWRMPPNTVSVARGPGRIWGNPWKVANPGFVEPPPHPGLPPCGWNLSRPLEATEAVSFFRAWMEGYALPVEGSPWRDHMTKEGCRMVWDAFALRRAEIFQRLPELRGKRLACWCKPGSPCHADVLLELANA